MGNVVDVLEMAIICGKWFKYFDYQLEYVENDLEIWEMATIFPIYIRHFPHI